MSIDQILVVLAAAAAIIGVAWFFWGPRGEGVKAAMTSSGYQEAMILVKGGYTPDTILVQRGKPVRLNFRREETAACSEMVVFSDFGKSAELPEGEVIPVEFVADETGEYEFTCQMGMLRGKVVVQ
jgi:plastocyanin domain-containing protein